MGYLVFDGLVKILHELWMHTKQETQELPPLKKGDKKSLKTPGGGGGGGDQLTSSDLR